MVLFLSSAVLRFFGKAAAPLPYTQESNGSFEIRVFCMCLFGPIWPIEYALTAHEHTGSFSQTSQTLKRILLAHPLPVLALYYQPSARHCPDPNHQQATGPRPVRTLLNLFLDLFLELSRCVHAGFAIRLFELTQAPPKLKHSEKRKTKRRLSP